MSSELRSRVATSVELLREEMPDRVAEVDRVGVAALVTILAGAYLRLRQLGDESIWLDEALSIVYVTRDYTTFELLFELPLEDPHPPLYYLLLDGWIAVFGSSEVAVRMPSALFGIASLVLVYAVGARLFDREAGTVAAALLGLSSFNLYYAQEARMYTLLAALTLASFYFLVGLEEPDADDDYDRWTVIGYVAATVLLAYTHVFGFFVIVAQNLYAVPRLLFATDGWPDVGPDVLRPAPLSLPRWIGVQVGVAAILSPWMLTLLSRVLSISEGGGSPISWIPMPELADLPRAVNSFFFFRGVADPLGSMPFPIGGVEMGVTVWLTLALATIGLVVRADAGDGGDGDGNDGDGDGDGGLRIGPTPGTLMLAPLFLTPLVGAYVVSVAVTPIFVERYTICASLGLFLLAGAGVSALRPLDPFDALRIGPNQFLPFQGRHLLAGLVLFGMVLPIGGYYADDHKEQWRQAVAEVEAEATEGAAVIITDSYMAEPYRYYADRPDLEIIPMDDEILGNRITGQVEDHDEVWVLVSHAKQGAVIGYLSRSYTDFEVLESYEGEFIGIQMYRLERTD